MQLLLKNSPNAGYETNDVVVAMPDDHIWGTGELQSSVFTIVTGVTIDDETKDKLLVSDEQIQVAKAAMKIPALRKKMINRDNMKLSKRRRYRYVNDQMERK